MTKLEKLTEENLMNQIWMKEEVLARLNKNHLEKIYARIFHAMDDSGSDPWDEKKNLLMKWDGI